MDLERVNEMMNVIFLHFHNVNSMQMCMHMYTHIFSYLSRMLLCQKVDRKYIIMYLQEYALQLSRKSTYSR